jgi:hypothetical protein
MLVKSGLIFVNFDVSLYTPAVSGFCVFGICIREGGTANFSQEKGASRISNLLR